VIAQDTEKDKGKEGKVKKSKKGKGKGTSLSLTPLSSSSFTESRSEMVVVNEEALQPTTATSKRRKRSRDSDSGSRSTSIENPPVTTKSRKRSRVVVGGTEEGEAGTKEIEEQKEEKVKVSSLFLCINRIARTDCGVERILSPNPSSIVQLLLSRRRSRTCLKGIACSVSFFKCLLLVRLWNRF